MTIGFALIFQDLALLIWGGDPYTIPVPAALQGVVAVGGLRFPRYRIFIMRRGRRRSARRCGSRSTARGWAP